jgi:hypothetical protein
MEFDTNLQTIRYAPTSGSTKVKVEESTELFSTKME